MSVDVDSRKTALIAFRASDQFVQMLYQACPDLTNLSKIVRRLCHEAAHTRAVRRREYEKALLTLEESIDRKHLTPLAVSLQRPLLMVLISLTAYA